MGRKKKRNKAVIFCYYCDRMFESERVLIQHQRAKHFKCPQCHKRISSAHGMMVHVFQVHKETIERVPASKEGRDGFDIEIFGMDGVPQALIDEKRMKIYGESAAKRPKVDQAQGQPGFRTLVVRAPQPGLIIPGTPASNRFANNTLQNHGQAMQIRAPVMPPHMMPPHMMPGQPRPGMPFPTMPFPGAPMPVARAPMPVARAPMPVHAAPMPGMPGMPQHAPPGAPGRPPQQPHHLQPGPKSTGDFGPKSTGPPPGAQQLPPQRQAPQMTGGLPFGGYAPAMAVPQPVMQPTHATPIPAAAPPPSIASQKAAKKKNHVRVYDDEDFSQEEKRAMHPKYSTQHISALSDSIEARLQALS